MESFDKHLPSLDPLVYFTALKGRIMVSHVSFHNQLKLVSGTLESKRGLQVASRRHFYHLFIGEV